MPPPIQLLHQFCGLMVVQVPSRTAYAGLEKIGIRATGKHRAVVVGLDHQSIHRTIALQHLGRGHSQIGEHAEAPLPIGQHELGRLAGVVRDANHLYFQPADRQALAGPQQLGGVHRAAHAAQGTRTEIDRDLVMPRQQFDAMDVIGVFVRDQDRVQLRGAQPQARQTLDDFTQREAAIDQYPGVRTAHQGRIAPASAAQNREPHCACSPGVFPVRFARHRPAQRC